MTSLFFRVTPIGVGGGGGGGGGFLPDFFRSEVAMKDRDSKPADDAHMEETGNVSCGGDTVICVECGLNKAVLHLDKLCQGSKGACILFDDAWMPPNEFQAESGRETAKDWKRSIKHHDKSIKLLMINGLFSTDPAVCSCNYTTLGLTYRHLRLRRRQFP